MVDSMSDITRSGPEDSGDHNREILNREILNREAAASKMRRPELAPSSRTQRWLFASVRLALTSILVILALRLVTLMTTPTPEVGLTEAGHLGPCPASPNCVATYGEHSDRRLAPLTFQGSSDEVMDKLERLIRDLPRTRVITRQPHYLHVEFQSWLFRFVDDVEFLVMPTEGVIHFRSASRVGYSDLGANRRRMEKIRETWESPDSSP